MGNRHGNKTLSHAAPIPKTNGHSQLRENNNTSFKEMRVHYVLIIPNSSPRTVKKIQQKTETNPLSVLHQAIRGVTPDIEIKARRVGGSTHQVP